LEQLLPAYDDPLFSILLIIVLGLIIAVATYGWSMYKQQKEQGNLLKFLDKFDTSDCALDTKDTPYEKHMFKPFTLLAKAFETTGEYHKAISIYLYLIKNVPEELAKNELLERLGSTYLHAGFLERSRSIYTDILRKTPRNTKILYELGVVYEMMHQYDKAKEVIEPLQLLKEDTFALKKFLEFSQIQSSKTSDSKEKIAKLNQILEEEPKLYREVVSALLKLDIHEAWQIIDPKRIKEILDILWFLPQSQLGLDIISANQELNTLYYVKGYLPKPKKLQPSGIFALDMLASAKVTGFEEADLHFSYLCKKCKQSFPVSFRRCPNCMAIHSVEVEESIGKASPKTDYSLL
jgi:tetratricopeptide (TPR) repeat protein